MPLKWYVQIIDDKEKPKIKADDVNKKIIKGIPIIEIPSKNIKVMKDILPIKLLIKAFL